MTDIQHLRKLSQPLYGFVYKYFEKLEPETIGSLRYDFALSPLEVYQLTLQIHQSLPELFRSTSVESDIMDLWAHKELVLQALVVLSNIPVMVEAMEQAETLATAVQIRNDLIDGFTQKAVEDPRVLHAIQNDTLEEEIAQLKEAKELFNSKPLFEKNQNLVIEAEGIDFKEIPERF